MPADSPPVLILFARQPIAGAVKTRLLPALGAEGTARLARLMLHWTIDNALAAWPGPVRVAVWPPESVAWFREELSLPVLAQRGADLGARMLAALSDTIAEGAAAAVLGCDVPHVDGAELHRAAKLLEDGHNVVGPALDGGFYLLGLSRVPANLFDGIDWGTACVYRRLNENAARQGLVLHALLETRDIDTPEDLRRVAADFLPLAEFLGSANGAAHG